MITAILKRIPLDKLLNFLLRALYGVTNEQWLFAISKVVVIASQGELPGKEKILWFNTALQDAFKTKDATGAIKQALTDRALNYLRESAVAYAAKKGLIK